mgnify:CR=1 FL=1
MSVIYEVTVRTGTYKNEAGEDKNRYLRIGSVIETKNGPMLKLDSVPLADNGWNGWAYLNTPRPKEGFPPDEDF